MKTEEEFHKYDDIIRMPHPVSKNHPQMSMRDRAAQFSPFAALTGHEDNIRETARLTDTRVELDEYELALLDEKIHQLKERIAGKPNVSVTYFQPDDKKDGGMYLTVTGLVKKIDEYRNELLFEDGTVVEISQIYDVVLCGTELLTE